MPIGAIPQDMSLFASTDCDELHPRFADCSAQDVDGRRYAFFDGALSRVSARRDDVSEDISLPGGIAFGEKVALSVKKVEVALGTNLERDVSPDGQVVYASDYVATASTGLLFSVELSADDKGRLTEVVERTDF